MAIDTGIKDSIVRNLRERGAHVELHPCTIGPDELLAREPDAVFLANGPGDPAALDYVVENVRGVVGKVPVWGICLGHQLLCRAVGLETFKLPFGHRGANHPVKDLETGRIDITSQNHGFAVIGPGGERTIDTDEAVRWDTDFGAAELSQLNLYDRTVEGLVLKDVPASTVQYHPEAGPGPARLAAPLRPLPGAAGGRMNEVASRNEELVRRVIDLHNQDPERVLASLEEFFDPEIAWTTIVIGGLEGETYRGYEGLRRYYADRGDAFGPGDVEVLDCEPAGDDVLVLHVRDSGVGRTSGVSLDQEVWSAIRLRDGRVLRWLAFRSRAEAEEAARA